MASTQERQRTESTQWAPLTPVRSAESDPVVWSHVPLVPQVVVVGQRDGLPVAVIDQVGSAGFRAGLCNGKSVGTFRTLDECKRAVAAALDARTNS